MELWVLSGMLIPCIPFWWQHTSNKAGIHWKSWDILKERKSTGGFGFRDLLSFNRALLGRQAWRMFQHPLSLWCKVFKALYFPSTDFWHAEQGSRPSWGWRSLLMGRDSIIPKLCWSVGNGQNINARQDKWLPMGILCGPSNREEPKTVAGFINTEQNAWNNQLLNRTFDEPIVKAILAIKLWPASTEDRIVWTATVDGQYTVKSAYHVIQKSAATQVDSCPSSSYITPSHLWKQIWKTKTDPKIRIFLWSISQNAIPTKSNLFRRRIINDPCCILCSTRSPETVEHLFLHCPWTQQIWSHPIVQVNVTDYATHRIDAWLADISQQIGHIPDFETIAALLWQIWKARNHLIFRHQFTKPDQLVDSALALAHLDPTDAGQDQSEH